jgi:protein TonB
MRCRFPGGHLEPDGGATGYRPGSPRQRVTSTLLSAAIVLLALLLAIYGSGVVSTPEWHQSLTSFDVTGANEEDGTEAKKEPRAEPEKEAEQPRQEQVAQPAVSDEPAEEKPAFTFLRMSREEYAAADIGRMKSSGLSQSAPSESGSGGTYGPGEGPGGAILYRAQWHREPSDAQLGGYLPVNAPASGWGEIACQTVENFRVENCQILAESPRGSGFARAVQNAAWQFEVVPPRINGKPQLGTWVRIRIDYGARRAG